MKKTVCFLLTGLALCQGGFAANATPQAPTEQFQQTLSIVKPDAVEKNQAGAIMARMQKEGFHIAAIKMVKLTPERAKQFYAVHKDRPFYGELVEFMSSGPVVAMVLESNNAIAKNRDLMGDTNPKKAASGTLRAEFGESIGHNAVHGSDSPETAPNEIMFFFQPNEIFSNKAAK